MHVGTNEGEGLYVINKIRMRVVDPREYKSKDNPQVCPLALPLGTVATCTITPRSPAHLLRGTPSSRCRFDMHLYLHRQIENKL